MAYLTVTRPACKALLALVAWIATGHGFAAAAPVWDEADLGDLSTLATAPSHVSLAAGSNVIRGTVQAPGDTRDFITFTLEPAQRLAALLLLEYVDGVTGAPGNRGYHAINGGSLGLIPGPANTASFLGGDHLDPSSPATDLLPRLAAAPLAGTGFGLPLGPGSYTYVIQQTGPQLTRYALDFRVEVVPLPAPVMLLAPALGLLGLVRRTPSRQRPDGLGCSAGPRREELNAP